MPPIKPAEPANAATCAENTWRDMLLGDQMGVVLEVLCGAQPVFVGRVDVDVWGRQRGGCLL